MHCTAALELARKLIYCSQCFSVKKKAPVDTSLRPHAPHKVGFHKICLQRAKKGACKKRCRRRTDAYRRESTDYSYHFIRLGAQHAGMWSPLLIHALMRSLIIVKESINYEQLLCTEAASTIKRTCSPMQYCKNSKTTQYTKL